MRSIYLGEVAKLKNRILVTGAAGFIGSWVLHDLSTSGFTAIGIDNFSNYYHPSLKRHRIEFLGIRDLVSDIDIENYDLLSNLIQDFQPDAVINLAAQGGVRASKADPYPYITSNQLGFVNVLKACEEFRVGKLIYASSSSVYGDIESVPFSETAKLPAPKSLYAASKLSNELVAKHFPGEATQRIGLRLFTVYGPMGRPDMAVFRILAAGLLKRPFKLTASLDVARDFTYIADVCTVIKELVTESSGLNRSDILNIAGCNPHTLENLFAILSNLEISPEVETAEIDVLDSKLTHGSNRKLESLGYPVPKTTLEKGVERTLEWLSNINLDTVKLWYEFND